MKKPLAILPLAALFALCMSRYVHADDLKVCGKLKHDAGLDGAVASVAFAPDGARLASAYNVLVGASPQRSKRSGQGGRMEGYVVLWDVTTKKKIDAISCGGNVRYVTFSPDGKVLAVAHSDELGTKQTVRLLDVASRKECYSFSIDEDRGLQRWVTTLIFSPDGKRFVVSTAGYPKGAELLIFDPKTGKRKCTLKGGKVSASSLSFSANGKLLTSISDDVVQVWDMSSAKERNSFSVGRGHLAVMSPDGGTIALSTIGSRKYPGEVALTLRDAKSGQRLIDFKRSRVGTALLFTPDGKKVVYGYGGIIVVYEVATGKKLSIADGPTFSSMAITRTGNLIATGNHSGTVWLWELGSRK